MTDTERPTHLKLIHSNESNLTRLFSKEEFIQFKEDGYTNIEIAEKYDIPEAAVFKIANLIYSNSL
ncbi:hypothetical protein QTG56_26130 (plasmid) [Rossellomorea sp. AcN35-11]|nr:hypothetical protein [Rossellomorea aquimaris]WJV32096.1 hypothetical protein QTG56_26130 [Rossellomorea sp. AcN35-11]